MRIIAATNRDLGQLVVNQQFREDLYYRLNVVPVEVPSLGPARKEIPLLAAHFIKLFNRKYNMQKELFPDVIDILMNYDWPGNVRELENVIERLVVTVPRDVLTGEDLPKYIKNFRPRDVSPPDIRRRGASFKRSRGICGKEIISHAYSRYRATSEVARHLGIDPSTVLRKAAKYGITVEPGKND